MSESERMRLEELEAAAAVDALDAAERVELETLRSRYPDARALAGFESIVAGLTAAAAADRLEPLPAAIEQRLRSRAEVFLRESAAPPEAPGPQTTAPAPAPLRSGRAGPGRLGSALPWLGWALAAGLAALSFNGVSLRPGGTRTVAAQPPAPAEARARMLQTHRYTFLEPFGKGPDASGAQLAGDVVWDDATQQGYLRLKGLKPNDPRLEEYQLWIFDAARDERYPVDGGVFDTRSGEAIIPIHAKIPVHHAVMFAVTVERPGGVVVSSRERIAALARPT